MLRSLSLRAFTLIEMMVVLLIMTTLMSLGVATWMNIGEQNRSLATQELVSSLIQQARNRSSSQGLPVSLYLDVDGTITGIDQEYIWHEGFDWPAAETSTTYRDTNSDPEATAPIPLERSFGRNGYAWKYPYALPGSGQQLFLNAFDTKVLIPTSGSETYEPLFQNASDGFLLNCAVKAPNVDAAQSNIIPLILLTEKDETDDVATAIGGIELWRVSQFILNGDTNGNGVEDTPAETWSYPKIGASWVIVGWLGTRPTNAFPTTDSRDEWYTNFRDASGFVRDWTDASDENDNAYPYPYSGNSWLDITLAYDNGSLYLFRNGARVDQATLSGFTPNVGQEISIYVGRHTISSNRYITEAVIDDSSLIRIGSGTQHILQHGLLPKESYKVSCHNGLISCFNGSGSTNELRFVNQSDQVDNLIITVNNNGTLDKKILTSEDITGAP